MNPYGDEDYIFYLSNLLEEEKREREKDFVYIGEELVSIKDKDAVREALARYVRELLR